MNAPAVGHQRAQLQLQLEVVLIELETHRLERATLLAQLGDAGRVLMKLAPTAKISSRWRDQKAVCEAIVRRASWRAARVRTLTRQAAELSQRIHVLPLEEPPAE